MDITGEDGMQVHIKSMSSPLSCPLFFQEYSVVLVRTNVYLN